MKLSIKTGRDLDSLVKDFAKDLKKQIRTKVVNTGMDKPLAKSIKKLRSDLKSIVNDQIRVEGTTQQPEAQEINTRAVEKISIPKSDADIIKFLFDVDLTKLRSGKDFTSPTEGKAFKINDNRVRLRIPENAGSTISNSYARAMDYFKNGVFLESIGNKLNYYFGNSVDLSQHVKIVCSTETGITEDSSKVFDSYKDSDRRVRHTKPDNELGRFSEWTLKQNGVEALKSSRVDVNAILDKIKEGSFDEAVDVIRQTPGGSNLKKVEERIVDIRDGKENVPKDLKAYTGIIKMINGMRIEKKLMDWGSQYSLITLYDIDKGAETTSYEEFENKLRMLVGLWIQSNEAFWVNSLVKEVKKTINLVINRIKA